MTVAIFCLTFAVCGVAGVLVGIFAQLGRIASIHDLALRAQIAKNIGDIERRAGDENNEEDE